MTVEHNTDTFLQLEQTASQIVEELNQLKVETRHYSESAKSLDECVAIIQRLGEGLGTASSEIATLSSSIREEFSAITNLRKLVVIGIAAIASLQIITLIAVLAA